MSSFSTTLSLQNEILNSHEQYFFTKIRPYHGLTFIWATLWAFTLTLWCIPFSIRKFILNIYACGFWWHGIRIYSEKQLRNPRVRVFRERNRLISQISIRHFESAILEMEMSIFWLYILIHRPPKPASTNFQDKFSNAKWYAPKSQYECSKSLVTIQ